MMNDDEGSTKRQKADEVLMTITEYITAKQAYYTVQGMTLTELLDWKVPSDG